ncbi:antitoxin [Actinokineospora iranica]|uniref:MT0933-like antitoxin protein n=1 Tax=Actinokineospora iranica TaxID=1271860 RepID=A0A1G6WCK8_9PSEU|nr:antitoxin [Actinokineospora iranica]SDD63529.1 MT0933-like antitoxin protein [Actinokineospora iranica]
MPLLKKLTALAGAAAAARKYAQKNPEKVNRLATKAGQFVDQRTKGKYHRQIDGAVRKVQSAATRSTPPAR